MQTLGAFRTSVSGPHKRLARLFLMPSAEDYYLWVLTHADLHQTTSVPAFVDFVSEVVHTQRSLNEG